MEFGYELSFSSPTVTMDDMIPIAKQIIEGLKFSIYFYFHFIEENDWFIDCVRGNNQNNNKQINFIFHIY